MANTTIQKIIRKHRQTKIGQVWHDYIDKVTQVLLENIFSNDRLDCITDVYFLQMKGSGYFILYAIEIFQNTPYFGEVIKVSGGVTLHANENIMDIYERYGQIFLTYTWTFRTYPSIALNITIENIQFASDYLECHWARLVILSESLNNRFTYCGHHTKFNIYPGYSNVNITIDSYRHSLFAFSASHTIFNKSRIVTIKTYNFNFTISCLYLTKSNSIFWYIFHITVRKVHNIVLRFPKTSSLNYDLYDGPGLLSKNLKNSGHIYETSTFQCVLQILTKDKLETEDEPFRYTSKLVNFSRSLKISSNESSSTMNLPTSLCPENYCAIFITSDEASQINITLQKTIYKGPTGEKCKYGGLVTGEEMRKGYTESLTICEPPGSVEHHGLTFFSKNSSLILLVYWYEHYSEILTTVRVSPTKCIAVQLDPCSVQQLCHTVFNMNNLTRCNSFLEHISHNHLRYYKNFDDFLDFVLFSFQDKECIVIQFRKRILHLGFLFSPQCTVQLRPSNDLKTGQELEYRIRGSFSSFLYYFNTIDRNTQLFSDYVAFYGETQKFCYQRAVPANFEFKCIETCYQRSEAGNFEFKCVETKRREHTAHWTTVFKRDYFYRIAQRYVRNKGFYIKASQSSSGLSNPLRILIMLNMFSRSWIDVVISKHKVNEQKGSALRDTYLTESIPLPFIWYNFKNIGYRWDQFILLKLDEKLTQFDKIIFNIKLKSRFDGQGNHTELIWSSGFNFSHLRDFKLISLPGRIYDGTLRMSQIFMQRKTNLKNDSLTIMWLHDGFADMNKSPQLRVEDCSKTKGFSSEPVSFDRCLNSSMPSVQKFMYCYQSSWYQFNIHRVKCLKYTLSKEKNQHPTTRYLIFTTEFHYMHTQVDVESHKVSWIEASNLCRKAGALLPYFTSRRDLDQLIRVLKLSRDGFLLEGLYIGLVYRPTNQKVNL